MTQGQTSTFNRIDLKYNGSEKLIRGFKSTKRAFEEALIAVLQRAGYGGVFGVTVARIVKGGTYKKGLRLGTLDHNLRVIEFRWQEGSNDDRFSLNLTVPHSSDTHHFHFAIDSVMKAMEKEQSVKQSPEPSKAEVIQHPAMAKVEASKDAIELAILKINSNSPDFGYFNRDDLDLLEEFGEPEALLHTLVAGKYLQPISENLFQLAESWRIQPDAPEGKEKAPDPVQPVVQPAPPSPTPSLDLLTQLKQADEILDKAAKYTADLTKAEGSISALEVQLKLDMDRLAKLKASRDEARNFLANPEIAKAQELKAVIDKIAKK